MVDTPNDSPEEFAPTREHEYQDSHYHDEELDVVNDEVASRGNSAPPRKKASRRPPPKPRHYED